MLKVYVVYGARHPTLLSGAPIGTLLAHDAGHAARAAANKFRHEPRLHLIEGPVYEQGFHEVQGRRIDAAVS